MRRLNGKSCAALISMTLGLFGTACQEQQNLPLTPGDSSDPQAISARLVFADPCQDITNKGPTVRDVIRLVNAERAKAKLNPLRTNDSLTQVAEFYACRLIDGEFFGHVDPFDASTVDSRALNFGYAFLKVGENLAAGQDGAEQVISQWMNSPGHRANILDPAYTEIGIAVKMGGRMGRCWVQEFGRPVTAGEEFHAASAETTSKPAASTPADHP